MATQQLREQEIFPSDKILKNILCGSYVVFEKLMEILTAQGVSFEWRYYRDSKAWLCKVAAKKKTIFWLSAWDGFFRTNFYFLERHLDGIMALAIDQHHYSIEKEWGKMIPLSFLVSKEEQLPDLLKMVEFKKKAK